MFGQRDGIWSLSEPAVLGVQKRYIGAQHRTGYAEPEQKPTAKKHGISQHLILEAMKVEIDIPAVYR
jgi:hypothetical protein